MRIRQKLSYMKEPHILKIDGIFAFSENDIWFASGSVHHYNPSTYDEKGYTDAYYLKGMGVLNEEDGGITRLWGSSSENLYGGGWDGAMVHFDGETWQRIESGTTLTIRDIWGALIPGTDKYEVLSVASDPNFQTDQNLIQITNLSATFISDYNIAYPYIYDTVWFVPNYKYFLAGSGIYEKIKLSDQIWRRQPRDISNYYIHFIRGTELNNIVAVGGYGEILHFNGVSWKSYREITGLSSGNYKSVNIKDDLIVAVGYNNRKGVVAIGRR